MLGSRVVVGLVVAFAACTALHVGYIVAHEPFAFDAWNVAMDTRSAPASVGRFFAFWWDQYMHANPRLGQPFSYLAYKVNGFAEVATPLAFLGLTLGLAFLGAGRRLRTSRDALLWMLAIGFAWFALPHLGRNMFSRAYSTNYLYTAALQVWFLVPLRLAQGALVGSRRLALYGLAGLGVGLCNEHTGPALVGLLLAVGWSGRARGAPARLPIVGAIGVAVGFALLFFAPGQGERYGELAQQVSLPLRLAQRGVGGLLAIGRDYVAYAAPMLGLAALLAGWSAWRRGDGEVDDDVPVRRAWRFAAMAIAGGLVVTATLFVSPKLGSRFFLLPMAVLLAAVVGLVDAHVPRPRALAPWLVLAVFASSYAAVRTVPTYREAKATSDARLAALDAAPPGSVVIADAFAQVEESWWFIGDDYRDWRKREAIAAYLGLARVAFRKPELGEPLGVAGVRLVPAVQRRGEACAVDTADFDLAVKDGFDLEGMRVSARDAVAALVRADAPLESFELRVAVPNQAALRLPREKLLVARWHHGMLVAHVAKLARTGRSAQREVALPASLRGQPYEIYVAAVTGAGTESPQRLGGTDGAPLRYTPWRRGVYWVLACDASECWVIAATRQGA